MRILIYILCVVGLGSCSLFDNEDPIPGFLVLEDPTLTTTANQGEATHNIKDVWVFDGPIFLGIFTLPAKVPVILDGNPKSISIFAGVRNNGTSSNALRYPFYAPVEEVVDLEPQQELSIPLEFKYLDNAKFDFVEDFESNHIFVEDPSPSNGDIVPFTITNEDVRSGQGSGEIFMEADTSIFERSTISSFSKSNNAGLFTFVELDYKCDVPFLVGYIAQTGTQLIRDYTVLVAPSEEWNKIYIDLSTPIAGQDVIAYTVQIASSVTSEITPPATINLDNIKLIHF